MSPIAEATTAVALNLWDGHFADPYDSAAIARKKEERKAAAKKAQVELERYLKSLSIRLAE
jgi:hypothetical protein